MLNSLFFLKGHHAEVWCLAVSPDGDFVVGISYICFVVCKRFQRLNLRFWRAPKSRFQKHESTYTDWIVVVLGRFNHGHFVLLSICKSAWGEISFGSILFRILLAQLHRTVER